MNISERPDIPTRRPLRSRHTTWALTATEWLVRLGVAPNDISLGSVGFAVIAALALCLADKVTALARVALLLGAAMAIQLRLAANLLDGMVAIEGGRKTRSGELFNEVPDRIADAVILVGAGYGVSGLPWASGAGWTAALLAMMTAYVRALGASLGSPQLYTGPMAKPHRMAVLTLACLGGAVEALLGGPPRAIALALVIIAIGCVVTVVRRLRHLHHDLEER
jgi:phosphatidylglycerophosphate synthase